MTRNFNGVMAAAGMSLLEQVKQMEIIGNAFICQWRANPTLLSPYLGCKTAAQTRSSR
jgi:hypothetical protein